MASIPFQRARPLIFALLLAPLAFDIGEDLPDLRDSQFVFEGGHIAMAHVAGAIAAVQGDRDEHIVVVVPCVAGVVVRWGWVFAVGQGLLPIGLAAQISAVATGTVLVVKRFAYCDVIKVEGRDGRQWGCCIGG